MNATGSLRIHLLRVKGNSILAFKSLVHEMAHMAAIREVQAAS